MNWNDLRLLIAIAEAGSLAGAARELQLNHSTVFRRLNQLEAALAVRLFERFNEGYVLTPAGERMLELSREAAETIQTIEREMAGQDFAPTGTVRITTAVNIARTLLPPVLKTLRQSHPQILVEIAVGDGDYDLNRREADIALRATQSPPAHLIGRKVAELDWCLCGAGEDEEAPTSEQTLRGHPLIGADRSLLRLQAFQWLEKHFGEYIVARANDLSTMAALTLSGVGFSLLPSDQQEAGLRRHFRLPVSRGQLWLLTHPDLKNVHRIRVVWEAIFQQLRHKKLLSSLLNE